MNRKKLLITTSIIGILLFVVNILATKYSWYFYYWWFDMPMHFVGGVFVFLLIVYIMAKIKRSGFTVNKAILLTVLIGLLWELYEVSIEKIVKISELTSLLDSISDVFFDTAGALSALLLLSILKKRAKKYEQGQ